MSAGLKQSLTRAGRTVTITGNYARQHKPHARTRAREPAQARHARTAHPPTAARTHAQLAAQKPAPKTLAQTNTR